MRTKRSPAEQEGKRQAKVDSELLKQIDTVAAGDDPVEAIFMLRPDDPTQIAASPERTEELAREILQRVEAKVGSGANRVNVFRNLGTFTISAKPAFLRELLAEPEVASAMANRQHAEAYIQPHDVEPVTPGSNRGWSSPESSKTPPTGPKSTGSSSGKKTRKAAKSRKKSGPGKSNE
jgi:hypothetical protein